ncbi:MAG: hypothetical protein QW244_01400 [Candidatus Pacearchaeota archaeon]
MKRGNFYFNTIFFILALISLVLPLTLLTLPFSSAIINETKQVDLAYKWLENATRGKWQTYPILDHEFALLALSYKTELKNQGLTELKKRGYPVNNPYCFGEQTVTQESQCKVKETALASFIYNQFGLDTSKINEFLLNRSSLFTQIQWYLQLDVERWLNATCNISYIKGNIEKQQTIIVHENKSVSGSGECLKAEQYWVKIDQSNDCYNANFKILCEVSDPAKPYSVSLLYKDSTQKTKWYVADLRYSVESGSSVEVSVKDVSKCLTDAIGCDYEANAIAAYVLKLQENGEYRNLLPYLRILAENNKNVNSHAWLYLITGDSSYAASILKARTLQGYWLISKFGQSYDTAINAYSLIKNFNNEYNESKTKDYLLNVQNNAGYWKCAEPGCKEVRDTAMLLYVFWPKVIPVSGGIAANECEAAGGTCFTEGECALGTIENKELSVACGTGKCCIATSSLSCYDPLISGNICSGNDKCSGITVQSLEGDCCVGQCVTPEQTCEEQYGYLCNNTRNEYCPSGYDIVAKDTSDTVQCCSLACQSCSEMEGNICGSGETCKGYQIGDCCVGTCITSKECSELNGEVCNLAGWSCRGKLIEAADTSKCCIGTCIKDCASQEGIICSENEKCEGTEINASDITWGQSCCIGECKEKGKAWIFVLIIFLILIIGGVLFYLTKKGKLKIGKKGKPPSAAPTQPAIPPAMPPRIPPIPLLPRPIPKMIPKEERIVVGEEKVKEKERPKSKTEEQFAKTIEKIKKLTEKK